MTPEQFIRAGRLAFVNAVITVPLFLLSIILGTQGDYGAQALQTILMVATTLLFVYILLALKEFINSRHAFHDTDTLIHIQVWTSIVLTVFSMLGLLVQSLREAEGMLSLFLIVGLGIVQAVFGYRLLRLPAGLHGRLKPFCYLTIATGVCFAVVVLIPIGLITSTAADVMLGMILIRGGKEPLCTGCEG